ncbi:glycosyl hydrolase family 5 [Rhizobium sp. Leaf453]|nr:glycosyl hydrolase family 5 [Rhizobium sp. Leaf386]KQT06661.1 glycosyl hydrolase family 5 [Rhizobium sp. Leaf391]KQU05090.1 glycosyl hydrolase family 5 [Rhizobium sp. Leaf453]
MVVSGQRIQMRRFLVAAAAFAIASTSYLSAAQAARITNPVAVFSGIDKITGRITTFDVYIGETVQFGALQVTPRVCYSRDDTEAPKTDTFVEVDEITLDRKIRRIFTGWMFADSPGLNAVEHPVYDVWLNSCKAKSDLPPPDDAAKQ